MVSVTQKVLVWMALISILSSLLFSYLNLAEVKGLYLSSNGFVDNKYYQHISPAGTAFAIVWPIIYLANLAGAVYMVVAIFLPEHKSALKMEPTLLPNTFLVFYSLAWFTTVGWLFAFDREILELSLVLLVMAAFFFYVALAISYKRVHDNLKQLRSNRRVLWITRILFQNFLCFPATWLSIASFIQIGDVIIYEDSLGLEKAKTRGIISVEDGSSVILSVLFATIVAWFFIQNFVLRKYVEQSFTVFPVLILGLSALVGKLRFAENAQLNLILASVQLGFCVLAFLIQIGLSIYRNNRNRRASSIHSETALSEKL